MKARYIGKSFGVDGLTNGNVYEILEVDRDIGALRVVDDSGEDYLYSPSNPKPIGSPEHTGGRWEIVEDSPSKDLRAIIPQ